MRIYACFESGSWCTHVWIFGLWTSKVLFPVCMTIGKGTSCSATLTIHIRYGMSPNFDKPNWVRGFPPLFVGIFHKWRFVWMDVIRGFRSSPQWSCLCRATCMETPCSVASSFPPCGPHHMHATSSSYGDLLQVEVKRGLCQSSGSHDLVRLRVGVRVA